MPTSSPSSDATVAPQLVRAIGRWTLTALVLNGMIGGAILVLPGTVAQKLGGWAPIAYVLAALGIGIIMLVFAELASQYREAGGVYLYARDALGRFAGIQTGWFLWLMRLTSAAAVMNIIISYLAELMPSASQPFMRISLMGAILGLLTVVNVRGVRAGAWVLNVFVIVKLVTLAVYVTAGLLLVHPSWDFPHQAVPTVNWTDALLTLFFAYSGFELAMIPAREFKDPRRDAPFSLIAALILVAVLYVSIHLVTMWALPNLAYSERPLADAARAMAGPVGAILITIGAVLSTYGYMAGQPLGTPRLTFALAEQGDFPAIFAKVHPRFNTPYISILAWAAIVFLLATGGTFYWNAILSVGARLITYMAACASLIVLRRRSPKADAFRAPAGMWLAVIGIVMSVALVSRINLSQALTMVVVALVAAANWLVVRRRTTRP